jgi:hypothetical protein
MVMTIYDKKTGDKVETTSMNVKSTMFTLALKGEAEEIENCTRVFNYGFMCACVTDFIQLLYAPDELMTNISIEELESMIQSINDMREINLTKEQYIEWIDQLESNYLDSDDLIVIKDK